MKTHKKKIHGWKFAALLITLPIIFFVLSCQEQAMNDLRNVGQNSMAVADFPSEVQEKLDDLRKRNPDNGYVVIELTSAGLKTLAELEASNPQGYRYSNVTTMNTYHKSDGTIDRSFAFLVKGDITNQLSLHTLSADSVYSIVDNNPAYPGGLDSLKSYIQHSVRYPDDARMKGQEGKVFVQFIVEKDGEVTGAEVLKGFEPSCDQEALKVVSSSRRWIPGTQKGQPVRVKFVVPISFQLAG